MVDIDYFVKSTKDGPENFVLTDKGDIDKFLFIKITQLDEKSFKIFQSFLIDIIVSFLGIYKNYYGMETNANSTPVEIHFCIKTYLESHANKVGITESQSVC